VPKLVPLVSIVLALAGPVRTVAEAAERALSLEAELGGGADGNPDRLTGAGSPAAGFATVLLRARGSLEGERSRVLGTLTEGGRFYPGPSEASAAASRLEATATTLLSGGWTAGLSLVASDLTEEGHELDDDEGKGLLSLAFETGRLRARLGAGFELDRPRGPTLIAFEELGPEASFGLDLRLSREHVVSAGYGFEYLAYPRWEELAGSGRADTTQTFSFDYGYDGNFLAGLGYAYAVNRSTVAGGDFERHRVTGRLAAYLPAELTLALRAALQWSHYPEPLYLKQELLLAEENQDLLELRLTRAISDELDVSIAYSTYHEEATPGTPAPGFARTLVYLVLSWRRSFR
jgi:hypothetical protein